MEITPLRQARCLIVDDEPPVVEALVFVLRRAGWQADALAQGAQVMPWLAAHTCDVIVLDLGLPDMQGLEVLAQIRAHPPTANTPVVVITAAAFPCPQERALKGGATRFVAKPFSVSGMLQTLQSVVQVS